MALIKRSSPLAAAGDTANALSNSQFEVLPFDAFIEIALTTDVAVVRANVYSGTDLLMENSDVDVLAAATPHAYPDHFTLNDQALKSERVSVQLTKISGAASAARTTAKMTPIV